MPLTVERKEILPKRCRLRQGIISYKLGMELRETYTAPLLTGFNHYTIVMLTIVKSQANKIR